MLFAIQDRILPLYHPGLLIKTSIIPSRRVNNSKEYYCESESNSSTQMAAVAFKANMTPTTYRF
jgi:hypothetical protein